MIFPSSADNAIEAAKQLAHTLQNPSPSSPCSQLRDSTMAYIKQLSVLLMRQTYAIQAAVTYPDIYKPLQPKQITKITKSPHPTPQIIENNEVSITSIHRVIVHQSKLRSQIISPDTPQPRRMKKITSCISKGAYNYTANPCLTSKVAYGTASVESSTKTTTSLFLYTNRKIVFGRKCHRSHGGQFRRLSCNQGVSRI